MKFIEVEYNCELKPLESVLAGVARPGNFYVSGAVEVPMPQVSIEDFGMLSFPVPDQQITVLLHHAERAPYGRGAQTILDTSVRCVWQIAAGKVRIAGRSWPANFASILSNVAAGLGCEGATVRAEFYKLLVYDRDGFFLPHRDTEKTDGMFGTLVLTLPSPHRGGEFRIRHGGRDVTVDTSSVDLSEIAFVAFYADCEHEALPVREGNRVCLVYNLVQKLENAEQNTLGAPQYASEIAETAAILDRFLSRPEAPAKIAWLLDHQYSPAGLGFAALKGADAAKAEVLREAAARARCAAHLGIVHIGESGSAEPAYVSYRSRRDRYRNSGNSEEGADFTVVTVDDAWQYVDEWRDVKDRGVEFGPIPLASGELLPEGALDKEPPDKKRLTEASGNEGASYERSYHRAALVLWRQDRYAEVLLQAGVAAALPYLKELTTGGPRLEALTLAQRIVEAWPADARRWNSYVRGGGRPGADHRIAMVTALAALEAGDLLQRFIAETVTPRYDGSENAALLSATAILDHTRAAAALSSLVAARMPAQPKACAELLWGLAAETLRPFPEVAEAAIGALDGIGAQDAANPPSSWVAPGREPSLGPEFLVRLFDALRRFPNRGFLEGAVEKTSGRPEVFRPATLVVPALEQIHAAWGPEAYHSEAALARLWSHAADLLLGRSETPPRPPSDWRIEVKLSCSCADCRELHTFALDPAAQVHRFRVRQDRRQHLHGMIARHSLDMTPVTERSGSPQTLVCTKNRRTFEGRMKEYKQEVAAMRTLLELAPGPSPDHTLNLRLQTAVRLTTDAHS